MGILAFQMRGGWVVVESASGQLGRQINNALYWDNKEHGKQMVRQQELPSKQSGGSY